MIFKPEFHPPQTLVSERLNLVLFPTDLAFYQSDYEAVMETKHFLRHWSQSCWPEDSFTAQENCEDLKQHIEDNRTHRAYGYMIYTLDKKRCLGSVYINPLENWPAYHELVEGDRPEEVLDARIDFWLRDSVREDLEMTFVYFLADWMRDVWKIRAAIVSRDTLSERNEWIADLKLPLVCKLKSKTTGGFTLLFKI